MNPGGSTVGISTTRFYLSSNSVLDASDVVLAGARSVPALAGGAASTGSTSVTMPPTVSAGAYYIIAKADADDAVVETQEGNNTTARSITIGGDLVGLGFLIELKLLDGRAKLTGEHVMSVLQY